MIYPISQPVIRRSDNSIVIPQSTRVGMAPGQREKLCSFMKGLALEIWISHRFSGKREPDTMAAM